MKVIPHSYRQTHRQTDKHAFVKIIPHSYRQTHRQTDRHALVKIISHSYRQTHRQTDRHALVKIIPHSYKQTHRQTRTGENNTTQLQTDRHTRSTELSCFIKKKVKERIVLREIHLRTTGRHLLMGSHSVICHPTEVTAPPSSQPGRLVLDLSTP